MYNDSQKYIKLKKRAFFWAPICKYSLFVTIQPKNASQKPKRWYLRIQTFFLRFSSHSRWCNIAARGLLSFASEHKICNTFALKRFVYLRNLVSISTRVVRHYGRCIQLNRSLVKLDMFQAFTAPRRKKDVSKEPPLFIFETIYVTCRGFIWLWRMCCENTKLNARLALRQRADLLVANISTNNVLWFGHAHFRCFTFYINQFIIHSQTHTHANK